MLRNMPCGTQSPLLSSTTKQNVRCEVQMTQGVKIAVAIEADCCTVSGYDLRARAMGNKQRRRNRFDACEQSRTGPSFSLEVSQMGPCNLVCCRTHKPYGGSSAVVVVPLVMRVFDTTRVVTMKVRCGRCASLAHHLGATFLR